MLWFVAAVATACVAYVRGAADGREGRWWAGFALVPLVISIDEIAGLHVTPSVHLRRAAEADLLTSLSWTVPEVVLALAVTVPFVGFLRRLPRWLALAIALAAGAAARGAIGRGGWPRSLVCRLCRQLGARGNAGAGWRIRLVGALVRYLASERVAATN